MGYIPLSRGVVLKLREGILTKVTNVFYDIKVRVLAVLEGKVYVRFKKGTFTWGCSYLHIR